jgi:methionyl-tRNA formyltransferase
MNPSRSPIRVALFGSYYRGFYTLIELLDLQHNLNGIEIVGVASDDPSASFVSPSKRIWQYPHTPYEEVMVQRLATDANIDVYRGRVKTPEFYDILEKQWRPDVCYMATFGQLIDKRIFSFPKRGFYNLHPSTDKSWPSYVGGNPFQAMLDNHEKYAVITLHKVNEKFDDGALVDVSDRVYIPEEITVPDLHKMTAIVAGRLAQKHLTQLHRTWW